MNNEYRQLVGLIADDRLRWLSNFLADEPQWDRRMLLRLGAWAASTVGALVIAILSVHWTQDIHREQLAALDLARQSRNLQAAAQAAQTENRRLTAAIDTLNSDRDRLFARVTVLEQGLDSVTGAVTRQNLPVSMVLLSATVPITLPPPVIAAPAVMPAHVSDHVSDRVSDQAAAPQDQDTPKSASPSPMAQAATQAPPGQPAPAEPQRQPLPSSTLYAPPDPAASRLVEAGPAAPAVGERRDKAPDKGREKNQDVAADKSADKSAERSPDRLAATAAKTEARKDAQPDAKMQVANTPPAAQEAAPGPMAAAPSAAAQSAPEVPAQRTDFGVDLGGANSLEGLRGLWQGLVKADPALLSPLRPIVVIRERSNGLGLQLRLVAGPLSDAAAAARICAALAGNERNCEATVFDGQRLTLKAQAEPVPQHPMVRPPPVATRSWSHSRHAAARPPKREEHTVEPAPPASPPPATTQSTPSSSVLPEFLRPR